MTEERIEFIITPWYGDDGDVSEIKIKDNGYYSFKVTPLINGVASSTFSWNMDFDSYNPDSYFKFEESSDGKTWTDKYANGTEPWKGAKYVRVRVNGSATRQHYSWSQPLRFTTTENGTGLVRVIRTIPIKVYPHTTKIEVARHELGASLFVYLKLTYSDGTSEESKTGRTKYGDKIVPESEDTEILEAISEPVSGGAFKFIIRRYNATGKMKFYVEGDDVSCYYEVWVYSEA